MKPIASVGPARLRRGLTRGVLAAFAAVAACAALSAPAYASISVSSFSVTPSTTQAGASPNLHVVANFSTPNADSPNDATLALAPGLLANATVPNTCAQWAFELDLCPSGSWIGGGTVSGYVPTFLGPSGTFSTNLYFITPPAGDIAEIGLIVNVFGFPVESAVAPVTVRTTPGNVGLDINFAGLPNSYDYIPLVIDSINLTINGSANGSQFLRNPTSCGTATSGFSAVSYGAPSQTASSTSSFTPTGCSAEKFSPGAAATATLDPSDTGVSYTTTFTQGSGQAGISGITVTTPPALSPNLGEVAKACTATVLSTCPSIGSASLTTPDLHNPITGSIVLVAHSGALPTPTILFNQPVALTVPGTDALTDSPSLALTTTFANLPDIPISSLSVTFNGGTSSLFLAQASSLCTPPQYSSGTITGQNGASVTGQVATSIVGCPASTSSTSSTAGAVKSGSVATVASAARSLAKPASKKSKKRSRSAKHHHSRHTAKGHTKKR
jgi:hypothetical protein